MMELKTIELIIAVEKEFKIEIPDDFAIRISSIGQLCKVVEIQLDLLNQNPDSADTLNRIKNIALQYLYAEPLDIGPDTKLIEHLKLK